MVYLRDKGDPNCEDCEGTGYILVANGPDDCDKDPCNCIIEEDDDEQDTTGVPQFEQPSKEV